MDVTAQGCASIAGYTATVITGLRSRGLPRREAAGDLAMSENQPARPEPVILSITEARRRKRRDRPPAVRVATFTGPRTVHQLSYCGEVS